MGRGFRLLFFAIASSALISAATFACSSDNATGSPIQFKDTDPSARDSGRTPSGGDDEDEPTTDAGKTPGRIYAHTRDSLYLFEPVSKSITFIGKFSCVPTGGSGDQDDSVLDIALDRTGQMYGTTYYRFIAIDPLTAACTVRGTDSANRYPNSLSFVPQGTADLNQEALVGYAFDGLDDATIYTRIDLASGTMTDFPDNLNPMGQDPEYGMAGDFISLLRDQNKTYGILKQVSGDAGAATNQLAELDPATGKLKRIIGDIGATGTYGFGYWAGLGYGFLSDGRILEIDLSTGRSTVVATLTLDGGESGSWYGAGVTTDSPTQ